MAVVVVERESAVQIERVGDKLAIWTGAADDPMGVAFPDRFTAGIAGRLLSMMSETDRAPPSFVGAVEGVEVFPPAGAGAPARLSLRVGGETIDLLVAWPDLVSLAGVVDAALMAARTAGES